MMRWKPIASLFVLTALFIAALPPHGASAQNQLKTENVILITTDGLRIQELFGGIDPIILADNEKAGVDGMDRFRKQFWRDTPKERREALLPFFWNTFMQEGFVIGNKEKGSRVTVKNPHMFSFPGYAEILTGQPQASVDSNDRIRIKRTTILNHVQDKFKLDYNKIAMFGSWDVFEYISSIREGAFMMNSGYQSMPEQYLTPRMEGLNELQHYMLTPWDSVRFDAVTFGLAFEFLKENKPRFLYIAFGETDDWAHDRRYDRVIQSAYYFDQCLKRLWEQLQSMEEYRGKTSIVITTDHGRGITPDDWVHHNPKYPGSEDIWIAVAGPDTTSRGELEKTEDYYQSNVAATVLKFFGLDYKEFNPDADPPLPMAFE